MTTVGESTPGAKPVRDANSSTFYSVLSNVDFIDADGDLPPDQIAAMAALAAGTNGGSCKRAIRRLLSEAKSVTGEAANG